MINIEKAMKFLKDNDFIPNEFDNYIYSKDAHSANLAYILEEYAKQEREIVVNVTLDEIIKSKKVHQKSGFIIEITDVNILSLAPQILKELNKDK